MKTRYLIKIGEMSLKGGNKAFFERRLKTNTLELLRGVKPKITIRDRRFYLDVDEQYIDRVEEALSRTFGIVAFTRTRRCEKRMEEIQRTAAEEIERYAGKLYGRNYSDIEVASVAFKIEARRTDKSFPFTSYQIANEVGQYLNDRFDFLRVDVKRPEWRVRIEVREDLYIYVEEKEGPGGLPVGSAGRGLLMLSGGIDSPVAGYLMAKRGLKLEAVYFHTYPFTSDEALEKVKTLASTLAPHFIGIRLHVVPFTDFQLRIKERAREDEVTLLMRAGMVRIAEKIAQQTGAGALITGESLSQVASQTIESLRFTGGMSGLPVFRPLIGLDKEEIIRLSRKIGTFETSILPYEDCCTIFSPDHPVVKPKIEKMLDSWEYLDGEELIEKAASDYKLISFLPDKDKKPGKP